MKRTFNGKQYDLYERYPNDVDAEGWAKETAKKLREQGHKYVRAVKIHEFDWAVFYLG